MKKFGTFLVLLSVSMFVIGCTGKTKTPAKTPEAKTPAAKTPEAKTPAAKTPAAKTPEKSS